MVGSLWPLRDDEAAGLVEEMADHLGRGESVGESLAAVRRSRIHAGAPTASWAGLILLGDADLVPVPGGSSPASPLPTVLLAAFLLLGLMLLARPLLRRWNNHQA